MIPNNFNIKELLKHHGTPRLYLSDRLSLLDSFNLKNAELIIIWWAYSWRFLSWWARALLQRNQNYLYFSMENFLCTDLYFVSCFNSEPVANNTYIRRSHVIVMAEVCWDLGVWFVDWVMKNNFYLFGQSPVRGGERPHMLELNYRHSLLIINNKLHTETVMLLSSKTPATHIHDPTNYFRIFILIQSCSVY